jgi:lysozyme
MIPGIDISHWENVIDWYSVKHSDLVNFIFMKATQAVKGVDSTFYKSRQACIDRQIPWAAYHFYDYRYRASQQVPHFIEVLGNDKKQQPYMLPPIIDFEPVYDYPNGERVMVPFPSRENLLASFHSMFTSLYRVYGRYPIFYTNPACIKILKPVPNWLLTLPLWIAAYTLAPVPIYAPWPKWSFWQHSESGVIPGITGKVDLNRFNGDLKQLQGLFVYGS